MRSDGDSEISPADHGSGRADRRERRRTQRKRRSRRFIEQYERRSADRITGEASALRRPIRIASGILLILGGVAIGWLPGPGFVILALPGAFLLASEIRRAALVMDHLENVTMPRMRRVHARLRGRPKPEWVEADPEFWNEWCEQRGVPPLEQLDASTMQDPHPASAATQADEHAAG